MINAIFGKLLYVRKNQAVISTEFGIEFEVVVSARTVSQLLNLTDSEKENIRLLTVFQHREDSVCLFGFLNENEKTLFIELNRISGIASKQALKILSCISTEEFYEYVNTMNIKALAKVPGLGAKTAQKIILEFKNKIITLEKEAQDIPKGQKNSKKI